MTEASKNPANLHNRPAASSLSRRNFLERTSAALALTASVPMFASGQQTRDLSRDHQKGPNESQPGPVNRTLDQADSAKRFVCGAQLPDPP